MGTAPFLVLRSSFRFCSVGQDISLADGFGHGLKFWSRLQDGRRHLQESLAEKQADLSEKDWLSHFPIIR